MFEKVKDQDHLDDEAEREGEGDDDEEDGGEDEEVSAHLGLYRFRFLREGVKTPVMEKLSKFSHNFLKKISLLSRKLFQ